MIMMKFKKGLIIIMVFLCQNVAYGISEESFTLRPPSQFNKTSKEIIIKQALIDARNSMAGLGESTDDISLYYESLLNLSKFGASGVISAAVIRHRASEKVVMFLGPPYTGRAATARMFIKGIERDLNDGEWELVAHWNVIFLFFNNRTDELFVIQEPSKSKEALSSYYVVRNKGSRPKLKLISEEDIKPTCEPVHVDSVVIFFPQKNIKNNIKITMSKPKTKLRREALETILWGCLSGTDRSIIIEIINNSDLPIIVIKRPSFGTIEADKFSNMVADVNKLLHATVLDRHNKTAEPLRQKIGLLLTKLRRLCRDL